MALRRELCKSYSVDWRNKLTTELFAYQTTPHSTTEVSPAELLLRKRPRTRLDLIVPNTAERAEEKQLRQQKNVQSSHIYIGCHKKRVRKADDTKDSLASRVMDMLEEGNYQAAVRLVCGSDSNAEYSTAHLLLSRVWRRSTLPTLWLLIHPWQKGSWHMRNISFPNGSASGPDGLWP